jgi:hypothetical protein
MSWIAVYVAVETLDNEDKAEEEGEGNRPADSTSFVESERITFILEISIPT